MAVLRISVVGGWKNVGGLNNRVPEYLYPNAFSLCYRFGAASAKLVTTIAAALAPVETTPASGTHPPPASADLRSAKAAATDGPLSVIDAFQTLRDGVTSLSEIPGLCMEAPARERLPPSGGEASSKCMGRMGLATAFSDSCSYVHVCTLRDEVA